MNLIWYSVDETYCKQLKTNITKRPVMMCFFISYYITKNSFIFYSHNNKTNNKYKVIKR